ncbi:MAG: hypothetical protein QOK25_5 [Thermoleophilaceae bacterium]|nr:hypothetical protein [Thermoleophilaceae bacterium]
MHVDVTASPDVPREQVAAARERMQSLERSARQPPTSARVALRRGSNRSKRSFVADASVVFDGRVLAAHAAGPSADEAVDEVVDRLRRQLRRVVDAEVARRNEPAVIQKALADLEHDTRHRPEARTKPPEEREIVHENDVVVPEPSRYSAPLPLSTARTEMDELDHRFLYFIDADDGRGKILYLRHDGDYGLVEPE